MMFEYIQSIYMRGFKKSNRIKSLITTAKDRYDYKKVIKYIDREKSNYKLLLDLTNMLNSLIGIYSFEKLIDILRPYVSNYQKADFRTVIKHTLEMHVDDDLQQYDIEIIYNTNKLEDNPITGYYVTITNKKSKISNGYSLYSDNASKFPKLDELVNVIIRISFKQIISVVRKYILDNQKIITQEVK